jgi:hypothetical protein
MDADTTIQSDHPADRYHPKWFFQQLRIHTADGLVPFWSAMLGWQRERMESIIPSIVATAKHQRPPCRRHMWEGTKSASKTSDSAAIALWFAVIGTPLYGQIIAADGNQAAEVVRSATEWCHANPWLIRDRDGNPSIVDLQRNAICSVNGRTRIEVMATDLFGNRGSRPAWLHIDELTAVPPGKWSAIEDMLANFEKIPWATLLVSQNAGYLDSEAYKFRETARETAETDPSEWSFHRFVGTTPWVDEKSMELARIRNPGHFKRYWQGCWTTGTDTGISYEDLRRCVTLDQPHWCRERGCEYFASVDVGDKKDKTGAVVIALNVDEGKIELAQAKSWDPADCGGRTPHAEVKRWLMSMADTYGFRGILFDRSRAEQMMGEFHGLGYRVQEWSPASHHRMVELTRELVELELFAFWDCDELLRGILHGEVISRVHGDRFEHPRIEGLGHCDLAVSFLQAVPVAYDTLVALQADRDAPPGHVFDVARI